MDIKKSKYNIGDRAYLNVPDGEPGIIAAIIVYSDHFEYSFRTANYSIQLTEIELSNEKIII